MHVGIDEARHRDAAPTRDLACAAILPVGADDGGAADRNVGSGSVPPVTRIKEPDILDHQVGSGRAATLDDASSERAAIDPHSVNLMFRPARIVGE